MAQGYMETEKWKDFSKYLVDVDCWFQKFKNEVLIHMCRMNEPLKQFVF